MRIRLLRLENMPLGHRDAGEIRIFVRRPSEPGLTLPPSDMQVIALRRRLRLPLPLAPNVCGGAAAYGCGRRTDAFSDPHSGVPAHRLVGSPGESCEACLGSRSWPGRPGCPGDQRRLDLAVYGATSWGGALTATGLLPLAAGRARCRAAATN